MRRTLPVLRNGLSVAAAVVLLTACSGSDGDDSASSESRSSSASSSSSETTGEQADSEFCTEAAAVQEEVSSTFTGESDVSALPTILQDAADRIRGIEPPAELEADWASFADGIERIAQAAQVDFNDPEAAAAFQQEVAGLQQEFGTAFDNVGQYLSTECGLTDDSTETAAPPS
jgi:hypothetical protein